MSSCPLNLFDHVQKRRTAYASTFSFRNGHSGEDEPNPSPIFRQNPTLYISFAMQETCHPSFLYRDPSSAAATLPSVTQQEGLLPPLAAESSNSQHRRHDALPRSSRATLAIAAGREVSLWKLYYNYCDNATTIITAHSNRPVLSSGTEVRGVAWNHNGQVLAVATTTTNAEPPAGETSLSASRPSPSGDDRGGPSSSVALVETLAGRTLETLPLDSEGSTSDASAAPVAVAFGAKSRYLSVAAPSHAALWDLKKRQPVRRFESGDSTVASDALLHARTDPTDALLVTLSPKRATFYHLRHGHEVGRLPSPSAAVEWTCWDWLATPPGFLLVAHACAIGATDGRIRIYDYGGWKQEPTSDAVTASQTGVPQQILYHSGSTVLQVALCGPSPHGTANTGDDSAAAVCNLLCALSLDCLTVYDWECGVCIVTRPLDAVDRPTCLGWDGGDLVAIGNALGGVSVIEWRRDRVVGSLTFPSPIRQIAFGPKLKAAFSSTAPPPATLLLPSSADVIHGPTAAASSNWVFPGTLELPTANLLPWAASPNRRAHSPTARDALFDTGEGQDRLHSQLLRGAPRLAAPLADATQREFQCYADEARRRDQRSREAEKETEERVTRADVLSGNRALLNALAELRGELAQQGELLRGMAREQRALRDEVALLRRELLPLVPRQQHECGTAL